jgi:transposase
MRPIKLQDHGVCFVLPRKPSCDSIVPADQRLCLQSKFRAQIALARKIVLVRIRESEGRLAKWHRQSRVNRLLATEPGVGIMGASAIAATGAGPYLFDQAESLRLGWG